MPSNLYSYTEREHIRPRRRKQSWYSKPGTSGYRQMRERELKEMVEKKTTLDAKKPPWCSVNRQVSLFRGSKFHVHNSHYKEGYLGQNTKCEGVHSPIPKGKTTRKKREDSGFSHDDVDPILTAQLRRAENAGFVEPTDMTSRTVNRKAPKQPKFKPKSAAIKIPDDTSDPGFTASRLVSKLKIDTGTDKGPTITTSRRQHKEEKRSGYKGDDNPLEKSWDSNLPSPARTIGTHNENFSGDASAWTKDKDYYRPGLVPMNLWDDVHHTPNTGIFRHTAKSLHIIQSRIDAERRDKEDAEEARRWMLQEKRRITKQKYMDRKIARIVLEEMSGQLRHTQPGYTGPVSRPVTRVGTVHSGVTGSNTFALPMLDADRSDGFRGIRRLKNGEYGIDGDDVYSEPALTFIGEAVPELHEPHDRLAIIEPREDHLSLASRSPQIQKNKIKTWRSFKQNPKVNDWDHFNSISIKKLKQAVLPKKDKWAIEKIQARQKALHLQEELMLQRRKEEIKATRMRFFKRQQQNFAREAEINPNQTSQPPSSRALNTSDMRHTTALSPRMQQLATPTEKREFRDELPSCHIDLSGMVTRYGDLQQKERPEYIEERDRHMVSTSRVANLTRSRPNTAIPGLHRKPSNFDAAKTQELNEELEAFERRAAQSARVWRDY